MHNKKIFITLDLSKIDKTKVFTETYNKRDGTRVTARRYRIEVIPLKEPQVINDTMKKTHFVVEGMTKEERAARKPSVSLGDGIQFEEVAGGQDDWGGM